MMAWKTLSNAGYEIHVCKIPGLCASLNWGFIIEIPAGRIMSNARDKGTLRDKPVLPFT
jgi:hypothetical protein